MNRMWKLMRMIMFIVATVILLSFKSFETRDSWKDDELLRLSSEEQKVSLKLINFLSVIITKI